MSARKRISIERFSPRLYGARASSRIFKPFLGTWVTCAAYKGLVLFLAALATLAPISQPALAALTPISQPALATLTPISQPALAALAPISHPALATLAPISHPALATLAPISRSALAADDAFSIVSAGRTHTMAIKTDGSLWAWGSYGYGKLGNGIDVHPFIVNPIPEKVMDGVTSVSAGDTHTMAIKADGSLWACGHNGNGKLGDGTTKERLLFVKVLDGVASVSAGSTHTLAVKTDGSLWAWGDNRYGQLGDGSATKRIMPVKIMDAVTTVSAGPFWSMAVKTDGSLWAWGLSDVSLSGDEPAVVCLIPVKIMDGVASVSTGDAYTVAIKTDGSLWAWGLSMNGEPGDGPVNDWAAVPVKIMDNAALASAGGSHCMVIKDDGSLWAWGDNTFGQLGNGTAGDSGASSAPVKIMENVASVSAGAVHTMAIKEDGSLWAWGANNNGVFGNGTQVYSFIPTKITPVEIKVFLDGEKLAFDVPPRIIMGSTLVPLRAIFEVMGAFVNWDDATQTVTATKDDKVVVLTIGSSSATVNGQTVQIGQPGITAGGRTLAPLRFVAEAFGETVTWDRDTLTAAITS